MFLKGVAQIPFKNDTSISDIKGKPLTNNPRYLGLFVNVLIEGISMDSAFSVKFEKENFQNVFSTILHHAKMPLLNNTYIKRDLFRLTIMRSFNPMIVFSIEKDCKKILFSEYYGGDKLDLDNEKKKIKESEKIDFEKVYDYYENINHKRFKKLIDKNLSLNDWNNFDSVYKTEKICNIPQIVVDDILQIDGSTWLLEIHNDKGYYFIVRQSPKENDSFFKLCKMFFNNSSLYPYLDIY